MGNRNNKDKEIKETKESQKEIKSPKSGTRDELLKQKSIFSLQNFLFKAFFIIKLMNYWKLMI